jgi:exodeoxyribonuclease V gamma subunit
LYYAFGNRLDELATRLGRDLSRVGDANPLIPHTIVVPHPGMGRWLRQHLARQWGIAAGLDLVLPGAFVWRLARALGVPVAADSAFDAASLRWRLLALLLEFLHEGAQGTAPRIDTHDPRALYELATRLAAAYDRYLVFRPDWISAWSRGEPAGPPRAASTWQAALWRRVREVVREPHRAEVMAEVLARLHDGSGNAGALPLRVSVFGIASLPPGYLRVLLALDARAELAWYHPNPCGQWWGDIRAGRERAPRLPRNNGDAEDYFLDEGHALLASWGRLGREFIDTLYSHLPERTDDDDLGEIPRDDTLLGWLKRGLYTLDTPPAPTLPEAQPSLRVHACPTRWREVEVLHDALLGLFERDATLTPRDVVVMSPDIGAYADLIRAAFDEAPEAQRLPHSIADRIERARAPLIDALRRLVELPLSRLPVSEVLDWLATPAIARARGLASEDLAWIRTWVEALRIRWGVDSTSRAQQGVAAFDEYAWRPALTRALLSYAGGAHDPRDDVPCYPNIEGDGARVAGALLAFIDELDAWSTRLTRARTAAQWQAELLLLLDTFVAIDPRDTHEGPVVADFTRALADWVREVQRADQADLALTAEVMRAELARRWLNDAPQGGYLGSGVTVCAMVPMRNVPFRVVCLLGLNDGEFPRSGAEPGLDLLHGARRAGDRSQADDDRFLMLEALMAAGTHWHVSFVSADARDGTARPPSVLVTELIEFVLAAQPEAHRDTAKRGFVLEHPQAAHDCALFAPQAPQPTYSAAAARAANALRTVQARPFAAFADVRQASMPSGDIAFDAVQRCFAHPIRAYLRALGLYVDDYEPAQDDEPLASAGLERWRLRDTLFRLARQGHAVDTPAQFRRMRAMNLLPPGAAAHPAFGEAAELATHFSRAWRQRVGEATAQTHTIRHEFAGGMLLGELHGSLPELLTEVRLGALRATDVLALALRTTALHASGVAVPLACTLSWDTKKGLVAQLWDFAALSCDWLDDALAAYAKAQSAPLPLFPKASWAYACARVGKPADVDVAHARARAVFEPSRDEAFGDVDDADIALLVRELDEPLGDAFVALAERVLVPLAELERKP